MASYVLITVLLHAKIYDRLPLTLPYQKIMHSGISVYKKKRHWLYTL